MSDIFIYRMFVYSFCKVSLTAQAQRITVNGLILKLSRIHQIMRESGLRCQVINLLFMELWQYLLIEFHGGLGALDKVAESLKQGELYFQIVYNAIMDIRNFFLETVWLPQDTVCSAIYQKVERLFSLRRLTVSELITTYYLEQLQHQTAVNKSAKTPYGTTKFLSYFMREKGMLVFQVQEPIQVFFSKRWSFVSINYPGPCVRILKGH